MIAPSNQFDLPKRWFPYPDVPVINAAANCTARFQYFRSGRRALKSETCKRDGILKLPLPGKFGPRRIAYIGPTKNKAIDVFWKDFFTLIPKPWWKGYSKSNHEIYTVFGSMIKVGGPGDIEGLMWDDIYVTESSDVPPSTIAIVVMPALSDTGGNLTREGVPKRVGKGARDFNRAFDWAKRNGTFLGTDIRAEAFSWKSEEVLSQEELSIQRALLNAKDFREQFEATIETAGGGIWHAWGSDNIAGPDNVHGVTSCDYDP